MYLSWEGFQETFFVEKLPYWVAYYHPGKKKCAEFKPDEAMELEDLLQSSWEHLERIYNNHMGGGRIAVYLRNNPSTKVQNALVKYVQWGDPSLNSGRTNNNSGGNNMVWNQMQFMLQMMNQHNQTIAQMQERMFETRLQNQRLEDELDAMEEPDVKMQLLEKGIGAIEKIFSSQSYAQPQAAQLGTVGQRPPTASKEKTTLKPAKNHSISVDNLIIDCTAIKKALPDFHPNEVSRALAIFCQQNVEAAKAFLAPLIEQLRQHNEGQG